MALKSAASGTLPRGPVFFFSRKRLARRDAEFAELAEAFFAPEDCVSSLESSLKKSTSKEATLRSQVSALWTAMDAARAGLATSQFSLATATPKLDHLRANSRRLACHVLALSSTANSLCL